MTESNYYFEEDESGTYYDKEEVDLHIKQLNEKLDSMNSIPDSFQLVASEPTENQWGGLARNLIQWCGYSHPSPKSLFQFLGRIMPKDQWEWIESEPEMKSMDSVVSAGSRACLIYKAMMKAMHHNQATTIEEKS